MNAACLLSLALLLPTASEPAQDEIVATYRVQPREVEVGEPFTLVLELEHPRETGVFELSSGELVLDDTWILFDDERPAPENLANGRRRTIRRWTLASLEPGPRMLSDGLPILDGVSSVNASESSVEVRGVLAEGEDAPRPIRGFPPGFGRGTDAPEEESRAWIAALVLGLLGLVVAVLFLRRRGGRTAPARVATPMEQLAELQAVPAADPRRVCDRHFELTRLVRAATDAHQGKEREGLTDAEWLADVRGTVPFSDSLADLLERSEAIKYGGRVPTSWALEEAYSSARAALEGLETVPSEAGGEATS